MRAPRIVIDDLPGLRRVLVSEMETAAHDAIAARGTFLFAVPGGSVAPAFFPAIAGSAVDWTRTHLFWADERAVAADDPASNYAAGMRLLAGPAGLPAQRTHRLPGDADDLRAAAAAASAAVIAVAGSPPVLDVVLLGAGEDGHVASVFQGDAAALARDAPAVVPVYNAPKPPPRRLSLSMAVLSRARLIVVAAMGAAKAAAVEEARRGRSASPLGVLLAAASSSILLLDREAGERI